MNQTTSTKDLRIFGIGSGIILSVFGFLIRWRFEFASEQTVMIGLIAVGSVLTVCGLFVPRILDPVYKPWMKGAMVLGAAMTVVLMSVIFIIVVPIFSLVRFKDPLRFRRTPDPGGSYWETHRNSDSTLDRFSKPF